MPKFKIYDTQTQDYRAGGDFFTLKEAVDLLADYHDIDWEEETHKDLPTFLEKEFETDEERFDFLSDHAQGYEKHYK